MPYRWTVEDHRMGRSFQGEASSSDLAKSAVLKVVKGIGRGLESVRATVFRPSGGGWFARTAARGGNLAWEAWEPEAP